MINALLLTLVQAKVEVLRVSDGFTKSAWTAEGRKLAKYEVYWVDNIYGEIGNTSGIHPSRLLIVRVPGAREEAPNLRWRVGDGPERTDYIYDPTKTNGAFVGGVQFHIDELDKPQTVTFEIADGVWKTVSEMFFGGKVSTKGDSFDAKLGPIYPGKFRKAHDNRPTVGIRVPAKYNGAAYQILAFDKKGRKMQSSGSFNPNNADSLTEYFFQGKKSDLARIEVQVRPYSAKSSLLVHMNPIK